MLEEIKEGLQPRFPSAALFDRAADHILGFAARVVAELQDVAEYSRQSSCVLVLIQYAPKPALLSLRGVGSSVRHVVHVFHRIVTVGTSRDCDVVIKDSSQAKTSVLRLPQRARVYRHPPLGYPSRQGASAELSHEAPVAASRAPSSSSAPGTERPRGGVVMVKNKPCYVRHGEAFLAGDYEGMVQGP